MNIKESRFVCDIHKCERKPYMEMYDLENHVWLYLCFFHYIRDRLKRNKKHGYCRVDSVQEMLVEIRQAIFELEAEIIELKEKIK